MPRDDPGRLIYENPLATSADVADFRMEGDGAVSFPQGRMRLESTRDAEEGQAANVVFWCARELPDDIAVTWDFYPVRDPGLCIMFFAARGRDGRDLFSPATPRTGVYDEYHHGEMDALHISYFRRKHPRERAFRTCNLRKSFGFHMVARRPDPLPSIEDALSPYQMELIKAGPAVRFSINGMAVLEWTDDGESYGDVLAGGRIGFRQMAPLIAEYANLKVFDISGADAAH